MMHVAAAIHDGMHALRKYCERPLGTVVLPLSLYHSEGQLGVAQQAGA